MRRTTCTCLMAAFLLSSLVVKSTFAQNDYNKWELFNQAKRKALQEYRAAHGDQSGREVYKVELRSASRAVKKLLLPHSVRKSQADVDTLVVRKERLQELKANGLSFRILEHGVQLGGVKTFS